MTTLKTIPLSVLLFLCLQAPAQLHVNNATVSLFAGTINYQGDLKPNSFTFNHSNPAFSIVFRKLLNKHISWRIGFSVGKIEAADRYNRDYLKPRNLSFYSNIKEIYTGIGLNLLDISTKRFTPYIYGGIALYHFNPWTYDRNHQKVYLKPLSTEGQGLPEYPNKKPYSLTQFAIPFGGGVKFALTENVNIGIEFSQRKTFTDYLDDVSGYFVDHDILLQEKGQTAVDLSYRGDEIPGGNQAYPAKGTQRGTPSEMDWYYFFGLTFEVRLNGVHDLFSRWNKNGLTSYQQLCPRNISFQ